MTLSNNITSSSKIIVFASLILFCLGSCNFILENNEKTTQDNLLKEDLIETNKNEAKLLVMASQTNLDIIELCQVIKEANVESDIKDLVTDLEITNKAIFKDYKNIAEEKLISIPYYAKIEVENPEIISEKSEFVKSNLILIVKKISTQMTILKKLASSTNNSDFRELSAKTHTTLETKLGITKDTLEKLKINKIL